jgi:hypothetical protein
MRGIVADEMARIDVDADNPPAHPERDYAPVMTGRSPSA